MSEGLEAAGAMATAGLVAGAIEAGKVGPAHSTGASEAPVAPAGHAADCLNCGAALHGSFCHACGQAAHVHRSLLHLTEELLHGVFHFDAKGWRTLPLLVARPGVLTRRYIDGQRVRYVSPLALFLFTIFLMFFSASLTTRQSVDVDVTSEARAELEGDIAKALAAKAKAEQALADARRTGAGIDDKTQDLVEATSDLADARKALETMNALASAAAVHAGPDSAGASPSAPAAGPIAPKVSLRPRLLVDKSGPATNIPWLNRAVAHAFANPDLTLYKLKNSAYKYSFMLVPISLPFVWLLFAFRRGVTVYDHAIFVLYSLSFMSLFFVALVALGAAGLPGGALVLLVLFVPPIHIALQLRDTYGLGVWPTLWRTAALLVAASIVFVLFVLIIGYVSLA